MESGEGGALELHLQFSSLLPLFAIPVKLIPEVEEPAKSAHEDAPQVAQASSLPRRVAFAHLRRAWRSRSSLQDSEAGLDLA